MRPRQTAFNARTLQGPDTSEENGDLIISDLTASMEEFSQASKWLDMTRRGNPQVLVEINEAGHVLGLDDQISMEGVQVHINSDQVGKVIEFLKKWIPIILKKIRDAAGKFLDWAKGAIAKIHDRITTTRGKLKAHPPTKSFRLDVSGAEPNRRIAAAILAHGDTNQFDPFRMRGYGELITHMQVLRAGAPSVTTVQRLVDLYMFARTPWIMMGQRDPARPTSFGEVISETESAVNAIRSPEIQSVLMANIETVTGVVRNMDKVLADAEALQLKLNFELRKHQSDLEALIEGVRKNIEAMKPDAYNSRENLDSFTALRSSLNFMTRISYDLTFGTHFRMRVLSELASLVNEMISAPAE